MSLQDLNEELHKRESEARPDLRSHTFDPASASDDSRIAFRDRSEWDGVDTRSFRERHREVIRIGSIVVGVVAVIAFTGFTFLKVQQMAFGDEKVIVKIDGPSEVGGSESSQFTVSYANANRADLEDADLILSYPENFRPDAMTNLTVNGSSGTIHVGTIAGHSQSKVEVRGKFYGSKGALMYLKAVLRYKPEKIGSVFRAETQKGITVRSSSLRLEMDAPLEVSSGGVVEYRLDYTNASDVTLSNLRLKTEYPSGFHFTGSDPKVSEGDSVWYVGNLAPGQSGHVRITGTLDGSRNEAKIFKVHLGIPQGNGDLLSYSDGEKLTRMVASPLSIAQTVNGLTTLNANPGDTLQYLIQYQNDGEIGLRDTIITIDIQSVALDFSRLILTKGAYDASRKIITWKASDFPELANLAPGKGGEIRFSVPVLGSIPVGSETDKNFVIRSVAKIDSPDIPNPIGANKIIGSNTMDVKVNSKISVQARAFYQDGRIPNSGPIPPKVGSETTYTIHWNAFNTTNNVDQAVVTADLPTGVKWKGKVDPISEDLVYDERTNRVTWNLGSMANDIGGLKPVREVVFQVGITPQVNQVGNDAALLGESMFTAHDLFTDESLSVHGAQKTTSIPEDTTLTGLSYQVVN